MNKKKDFTEMSTDEKILERAGKFQVPYTQTKEEAFLRLRKSMAEVNPAGTLVPPKRINPVFWISSAAAVILLLIGIWFGFLNKPLTNVVAERGQHTEFQLPDGSVIQLNAESHITYNHKNFKSKRDISMDGEAFFSVKKGQTFTIHTPYADIKILGTSFNVLARKNSFKVSCVTGKVQVSNSGHSIIITPGESATMVENSLTKFEDRNIATISTWKNGEFFYENARLSEIFSEMERQFNVTFASSLPMNNLQFTGSFTNKSLTDALDIVCIPMGLTYEIGRNDTISIQEKKE